MMEPCSDTSCKKSWYAHADQALFCLQHDINVLHEECCFAGINQGSAAQGTASLNPHLKMMIA